MKTVDRFRLRQAFVGWLLAVVAFLPVHSFAADVFAREGSIPGRFALSSSDGVELLAFVSFEPRPDTVVDASSLTAFTCEGDFAVSLWIRNRSASDLRIIAGVAEEPKFQNGLVGFTWFPRQWPGERDTVVRERQSDLEVVTLRPKEVVEIGAMSIPSSKVRSDIGFSIPVVYFVSDEAQALHGAWTGRISMSCVIPRQGKEGKGNKAAEPGATDNPDDAKRFREDH